MRWSDVTGALALGTLPGDSSSWANDVSGDGSSIIGISGEVPRADGQQLPALALMLVDVYVRIGLANLRIAWNRALIALLR